MKKRKNILIYNAFLDLKNREKIYQIYLITLFFFEWVGELSGRLSLSWRFSFCKPNPFVHSNYTVSNHSVLNLIRKIIMIMFTND